MRQGTTLKQRSRSGFSARFNLLWTGQAVSQFGDYLAYLAVPWFIVELATGFDLASPSRNLGIWYALDSAPTILVGLFGGILVDRLRLRGLMVTSDIARAAAFGALALASTGDYLSHPNRLLVLVFASAFIVGSFTTLFSSALYTLVPRLVNPEKLAAANARIAASQNIAQASAPLLAGHLVTFVGFWAVFALNAFSYIVSAVSVALVGPIAKEPAPRSANTVLSDIATGIRFVWTEARLRITTIVGCVMNFSAGFLEATIVLIATDLVGVPDPSLGTFYSSLGIGAIIGSLLAAPAIRRFGLGRTLALGSITAGGSWALLAVTHWGLPALLLAGGFMTGLSLANIPALTIRQHYTPKVMLGRVLSATTAISWASLPVGALVGTWAESHYGNLQGLVIAASLLIVLAGLSVLPTILCKKDSAGPFQEPIPIVPLSPIPPE